MISLKEAERFHGHLGPYLVIGLLAGEFALRKLGCKKYFGIRVKVFGANKKPKSCLIDGLQLSCGATYGKGNIGKISGPAIKMVFLGQEDNKKITLELRSRMIKELKELKGHKDSESFARKLRNFSPEKIFKWKLTN